MQCLGILPMIFELIYLSLSFARWEIIMSVLLSALHWYMELETWNLKVSRLCYSRTPRKYFFCQRKSAFFSLSSHLFYVKKTALLLLSNSSVGFTFLHHKLKFETVFHLLWHIRYHWKLELGVMNFYWKGFCG